MKTCPDCQKKLPTTQLECTCGYDYTKDDCPSCDARIDDTSVICPHCRYDLVLGIPVPELEPVLADLVPDEIIQAILPETIESIIIQTILPETPTTKETPETKVGKIKRVLSAKIPELLMRAAVGLILAVLGSLGLQQALVKLLKHW